MSSHRSSAAVLVDAVDVAGARGVTSSVIHAAGSPGRRRQRPAEGAGRAGEHEAAHAGGDGLLEQRQRAGDVGVHERLRGRASRRGACAASRRAAPLHPGQAPADASRSVTEPTAVVNGEAQQVEPHDLAARRRADADQRLAQMPGAAGHGELAPAAHQAW